MSKLTPSDPRRVPIPPTGRVRAYVREWRDALIWVPAVLSVVGAYTVWTVVRRKPPELSATGTVLFVRPEQGENRGDIPLVGLDVKGHTVLARCPFPVRRGQHVRLTYTYENRWTPVSFDRIEPLPGG